MAEFGNFESWNTEFWRFSGDSVVAPFGVHGSAWLIFPWVILSGWVSSQAPGFFFWSMSVFVLYVGYLVMARGRKLGPVDYLVYLRMRYLQGGRWTAYDE